MTKARDGVWQGENDIVAAKMSGRGVRSGSHRDVLIGGELGNQRRTGIVGREVGREDDQMGYT